MIPTTNSPGAQSAPHQAQLIADGGKIDLNRAMRRALTSFARKKKREWVVDPAYLAGLDDELKQQFMELNEVYSLGFLGSCLRVIRQPDPEKPPLFITAKDAQMRENHRIIWESNGPNRAPTKVKVFNRWLEWGGRPMYEEIKFAPGSSDPLVFNLFSGWPVPPRRGDWSLLRDHIFEVICNSDQEQFAWFMTWLAHIFQFPAQKRSVAVVIRGEKGTGKSIVFDFIQMLMPDYFYKVADGKRALGNFNAHYEHTLLLLMEEAFWAGDQAKESILKDMITSPTLPIERKGIDTYMAANLMRVAMISNERWVVPAGGRERRFAVFDAADHRINEIGYFKQMSDQMNNGGLEAMMHDLLNYQPEHGWDVLYTPPATSGLREQVVESLRGLDRFMYELLLNGIYECEALVEGAICLDEKEPAEISMTDLRTAARDYLADHFPGHKAATFDMIERRVLDWFGATVHRRKGKANNGRWVMFPSLADCREYVRQTKRIDIGGADHDTPKKGSSKLH